jgi:hypothetical protein
MTLSLLNTYIVWRYLPLKYFCLIFLLKGDTDFQSLFEITGVSYKLQAVSFITLKSYT